MLLCVVLTAFLARKRTGARAVTATVVVLTCARWRGRVDEESPSRRASSGCTRAPSTPERGHHDEENAVARGLGRRSGRERVGLYAGGGAERNESGGRAAGDSSGDRFR